MRINVLKKTTAVILSLIILMFCAGCNSVANVVDELTIQLDLLMYGDEARKFYSDTLGAREIFEQEKPVFIKLCNDAKGQITQNNRTSLERPVTWNFLWLRCRDVEYSGVNYTLSEKQIAYIDDSVAAFKQLLEAAGEGSIEVECFIEDIEYTMHASSSDPDDDTEGAYLGFENTQKEIEYYGLPGAYDSVMFLSALPRETFAGRCSLTVKHGYCYANVFLPDDIDSDYETRPEALFTTTVALHEFIHALEGYNPILDMTVVPNPDEADKYSAHKSYTGDAGSESFEFYDDILRGKVATPDGKYLGMYPQIWGITPRYLNQIGALEYLSGLGD